MANRLGAPRATRAACRRNEGGHLRRAGMVTAELHRAAGALSTMPEDSKKPVTDRRFSAINENDDKRAFFGTRNGTSVELTPVDTYPQTILKLVSPAGIFEEKLYYSHLGFAKILTEYDFDTVLDIGSGSGVCARAFRFLGKDLTTIDIVPSHPTDVNADYLGMSLKRQFDLVWCSH